MADWAKRRAEFHYKESKRIGMRVSIAAISTHDLIPATVRGHLETVVKVETKDSLLGKTEKKATKIHRIELPVWIRSTARPENGSAISPEEWFASKTEMWTSITEIRASNLRKVTPKVRKWDTIATEGHDYEWLACGSVLDKHIMQIMPWDGEMLHRTQDARIVRSIGSVDPWVFDWTTSMWRLDARLYRTACFLATYGGMKRKATEEDTEIAPPVGSKRRKVTKPRTKNPKNNTKPMSKANAYNELPGDTLLGETMGCCSQCGTKKTPFRLEDEISGPVSYLDLAVPRGLSSHSA